MSMLTTASSAIVSRTFMPGPRLVVKVGAHAFSQFLDAGDALVTALGPMSVAPNSLASC
jgi:hypothetical protein